MDESYILLFRVATLVVMVGFLPVCAYTYFAYRLGQRRLEIERILHILQITSRYRNIYIQEIGSKHFIISVAFTMSIAIAGFGALLLNNELQLSRDPTLLLAGTQMSRANCGAGSVCLENYQSGALLAFGLGFLGAYIWGLQGIFRRYSMNDLMPIAFYHFGLRMLLSAFTALLIYHAVGGFSSHPDGSGDDSQTLMLTSDGLLLATVFLVGMFPQRGIRWLSNKIGFGESDKHPSVKHLSLDMIEGMSSYDVFRLEELGIDSCFDLANTDFIPLVLKTSYGARELIDWILQAKLLVRFGESVYELRARGIRTITDFDGLTPEDLEQLAKESSITLQSLQKATATSVSDQNIDRLRRAAELLSHYWEGDDTDPSQPGAGTA